MLYDEAILLSSFLLENEMPIGKKSHIIWIPEVILQSSVSSKYFLRGLFDTDGCIYRHSYQRNGILYQYPKIAFTSYSRIVRSQFFELLVQLQFNPKEYRNRVYLYSQQEALRFFERIRFC